MITKRFAVVWTAFGGDTKREVFARSKEASARFRELLFDDDVRLSGLDQLEWNGQRWEERSTVSHSAAGGITREVERRRAADELSRVRPSGGTVDVSESRLADVRSLDELKRRFKGRT